VVVVGSGVGEDPVGLCVGPEKIGPRVVVVVGFAVAVKIGSLYVVVGPRVVVGFAVAVKIGSAMAAPRPHAYHAAREKVK